MAHAQIAITLAQCADCALTRFPGTSKAETDDRTFYFASLLAYMMCNAGEPVGAKLLDLVALDAQTHQPPTHGPTGSQAGASAAAGSY